MKYLLVFILIFSPFTTWAQTSGTTAGIAPQISVEAPTEDTVVGQPAIVRIKVLVPTYMPKPPVFPTLEQENLLVRLPERASGPVSDSVGGETWSGVQRSYRIYPLSPGSFDLGDQSIKVTFADPQTNEPIEASVDLPPIAISAVVPPEARNLDPLIIAEDFQIEQQIDGATNMSVGDAITRQLTASIAGTSPIMIPELLSNITDPLLRPYPKEPKVQETEDRGTLSGTRVETVVYVAQDGGQTTLPEISIDWYNLRAGNVETATIGPVDLDLAAPVEVKMSADAVMRYLVVLCLAIVAIWLFLHFAVPPLKKRRKAIHQVHLASADWARGQLEIALKAKDLNGAYKALETLKSRSSPELDVSNIEERFTHIGAARYGAETSDEAADWAAAIVCLSAIKQRRHHNTRHLPPLNPTVQL